MTEARCQPFPLDFAQTSTPSFATSSAGLSDVHDQLSNPKTSSTEDKVGSEAGRGIGKEVSLIVHKNHQHAYPPSCTCPFLFLPQAFPHPFRSRGGYPEGKHGADSENYRPSGASAAL